MRFHRFASALLLVLTGCSTVPVGETAALPFDVEGKAYYACNHRAARHVASQPGDPLSLGIAARGMCSADEAVLIEALRRSYEPGRALRMLERVRANVAEFNATTIVKARAAAS